MSASIILFIVIATIIYAYTNHNREFTATASAIREIWSGSCRLSCRSEYSGYSGLNGIQREVSGFKSRHSLRLSPAPSCVCASCPCALVENVLRSCEPATNVYAQFVELISDYCYDVIKTLTDLYNYVTRVLHSGVTYQRQAQIISTKKRITEDLSNGNKEPKNMKSLKPTESSKLKLSRSFDKLESRKELVPELREHPSNVINIDGLDEYDERRSESLPSDASCSRCIEKGNVCMKSYPRARKKNK